MSKRKRNKEEDSDEDAPLRRVTKRPGDATAASAARARAKQAKVRAFILYPFTDGTSSRVLLLVRVAVSAAYSR